MNSLIKAKRLTRGTRCCCTPSHPHPCQGSNQFQALHDRQTRAHLGQATVDSGSQLSGQKATRRPRHLATKATPIILPGTQCSARPKAFFPGHMGLSAQHTKRNEPESWSASPLQKPLGPPGSSLNTEFFLPPHPALKDPKLLGAVLDSVALESSLGYSAPH